MISTGSIIDDKYEVLSALGKGGFGSVFKAMHLQFGRTVAIKLLRTTMLQEPDGKARFEQEAKAIDRIKHRNVVALYGYGIWQGAPYMVMEFVEGTSLEQLIKKGERLESRAAADLMSQVFAALAAAHATGIVHRDLKPSNIMVETGATGKQTVKIIDFGLAKLMPGYGLSAQKLTETGVAIGTCYYMAPEQCTGTQVDYRADIYAAGCILQHCLTGRPPFEAEENLAVMFRHLNDKAPRLRDLIGDSSAVDQIGLLQALQTVIDNCVAKNANERYQSAASVVLDLENILDGNAKPVKRVTQSRSQKRKGLSKQSPGASRRKLLKVMVACAIAGGSLAALLILNFAPQQQLEQSSTSLYEQAIRKWNESYDAIAQLEPQIKAIRDRNAIDHALTPQQEQRTLIWSALNARRAKANREALQYANAALALQNAVPLTMRRAVEQFRLGVLFFELEDNSKGTALLEDLIRHRDCYPREGWEVEQAVFRLVENDAAAGKIAKAKAVINQRIGSNELPSDLMVHAKGILAEIYLLEGKPQLVEHLLGPELSGLSQIFTAPARLQRMRAAVYQRQFQLAKQMEPEAAKADSERWEGHRCRNLAWLELATAASLGDHQRAEELTDQLLIPDKMFQSGIGSLDFRDRDSCRNALLKAHYNDLERRLHGALVMK